MDAAPTPPPRNDEERNQRHRRICQRLTELAMQLTEAAAIRALDDLAPDPVPAATQPDTAARPAQKRRHQDPTLTFTRLSSAVRQAMAHEARIDAAERTAETGRPTPTPNLRIPGEVDFRGPILHPILRRAAAAQPDRPDLAEEAAERLDAEILADPYSLTRASQILVDICQDLDLEPDFTDLSTELRHALQPDDSNIWRPPDTRGSKQSFFEKKDQKTFIY